MPAKIKQKNNRRKITFAKTNDSRQKAVQKAVLLLDSYYNATKLTGIVKSTLRYACNKVASPYRNILPLEDASLLAKATKYRVKVREMCPKISKKVNVD